MMVEYVRNVKWLEVLEQKAWTDVEIAEQREDMQGGVSEG